MIYDCFTFFNELDLLEIRLNILNDVVDKFVLVEATRTFTNLEKPLHFEKNKSRYEKFNHKIIHIVVDTYPEFDNAWTFEKHQRNSITKGLLNCTDEDIILISDVDEIPDPNEVRKHSKTPGMKVFRQLMFYYSLNKINIGIPYWANLSTKMLSYKKLRESGLDIESIRHAKGTLIWKGGWHFSYLGGAEAIALKIRSFSHQEYNSKEYTNLDRIRERVEKGVDLFNSARTLVYRGIPIDKQFPEYIQQNRNQYQNLLSPTNITFSDTITLKFNLVRQSCILMLKQIKYTILNKKL